MSVLITEQDFYDLAWAYLERAHADNVRHVEMFFDPQGHTSRGIRVRDGDRRSPPRHRRRRAKARRPGQPDHVLSAPSRRGRCRKDAGCGARIQGRIVGVGLDSSEAGHPPSKFKHVFSRARDAGFFLSAHAGEEGPPSYVWEALDVLGVARIDHGNRSLEDEMLVARLARDAGPADRVPAVEPAAAGRR